MIRKVFLMGKDKINWSIDSDRKNTELFLKKIKGIKVTKNIMAADFVYTVWYNQIEEPIFSFFIKFLKKIKKIKIAAVVTNDIRNSPEKIIKLKEIIDIWIAPSRKIYDFLKSSRLVVFFMPFLVDKKVFSRLKLKKDEICKELQINPKKIKDKFLIGSFQRDSLGSNLNEPKWQKNPQLLIEICKKLPKNEFVLVLAGPRRHYIVNACSRLGIPFIFLGNYKFIQTGKDDLLENNLSLEQINLLYNLVDLYIITSKSEGGPKAVLESALTKTAVFSTNVGLASDVLHPKLIFNDTNLEKVAMRINNFMVKRINLTEEIEYNYKMVNKLLDDSRIENILRLIFDLK